MKVWTLIAIALLAFGPVARAEDSCGDDGTTCGDGDRCCEHVIAMFSDDHAVAPPYVQGQCVPKAQKCNDYWCGNRECKSGFFGSPSVCCVNTPEPSSTTPDCTS